MNATSQSPQAPQDFPQIDDALQELQAHKDRWVQLGLKEKISLLEGVKRGIETSAEAQVTDAMRAKNIPLDSPLAGEDWLSGPYANLRITMGLIESLRSLDEHGHTGVTASDAYQLPSGQVAVKVFPKNLFDRILLNGFQGEVRLQPHVKIDTWQQEVASVYKRPPESGRVALVLGAGNVASIGILDVIHKLYLEAQVCVLKFNPVNEYLEPHYAAMLKPLIDEGFVRLIKGGAPEGIYLCQHELVDEIHITGSCYTHDAIVYGVGEEGAQRKADDQPVCEKRITSELGNVSPVIVVPGSWTQKEINFHAANIATMMYNNSGFNCNAARVVIMHRDWPQRRALTDAIMATLSDLEARPAYYPGAAERFERFIQSHEGAQAIKTRGCDEVEGALPVGLVVEVDPKETDHLCFNEEAFCAMAATTSLEALDTADFIKKATAFANDVTWGTLNATIIIDPRTARTHRAELDEAVDQLKFGSVCVNHWPALSYGLGTTTWGAFPGHQRDDIRSGVGVVHNTFMLEDVEKTVIYGPFTVWPHPPWFSNHKRSLEMARALVETTAKPSVLKLLKLTKQALRG
jgi:hypothetical protein